jgi:hypothetical protein
VNAVDFEQARAAVQASDDAPGKAVLLRIVDRTERLHELTVAALQSTAHTESVPNFLRTLGDLREVLQRSYDFLSELESFVRDLYWARDVSRNVSEAVLRAVCAQKSELAEIVWRLPRSSAIGSST